MKSWQSQEMLQIAQRRGDSWEEGLGLIWIAYAEMAKGRFEEAQKKAETGLVIFEHLRNSFGIALGAGIVLAAVYMSQGQTAQAKEAYEKGLEAARNIDYRRVVQLAYDSLGTIALLERNVDDAHSYFLKSLKITFENGQTREQLGSVRDVATVYKLQGKLGNAFELLAVVLQHPAAGQNSAGRRESLKDEAEALRFEIETMLSTDCYSNVWKRGQSRELGDVVACLLRENQEAPTIEGDLTISQA